MTRLLIFRPPKQWGLKKFPPKTKVGNFHNKACNLSLDVVLFLFHQDKLETKCVAYKKQQKKTTQNLTPPLQNPNQVDCLHQKHPKPSNVCAFGFRLMFAPYFLRKKAPTSPKPWCPKSSFSVAKLGKLDLSKSLRSNLGLSNPPAPTPLRANVFTRHSTFFPGEVNVRKGVGSAKCFGWFFASPKRRNRRWDEPLQFSRWRPRFLWVGSQVAKAKTSSFQ